MNNSIKIIADWLFWCYYYVMNVLKLTYRNKVLKVLIVLGQCDKIESMKSDVH